jgi:hypothetical protein
LEGQPPTSYNPQRMNSTIVKASHFSKIKIKKNS